MSSVLLDDLHHHVEDAGSYAEYTFSTPCGYARWRGPRGWCAYMKHKGISRHSDFPPDYVMGPEDLSSEPVDCLACIAKAVAR